MLNLSSILFLAVIQILISGSHANPQPSINPETLIEPQPLVKENELCSFIKTNECSEEKVRKDCPNLCISLCSPPWYWKNGQCFQVINVDVLRTWSSARMYCSFQDKGTVGGGVRADLAVPIDRVAFDDFMKTHGQANAKYWIGGSNLYMVTDTGKSQWLWTNARPILESPAPIQYEECIYYNNGDSGVKLDHTVCGSRLPFVCEKFII